jgi:hypothetical protein
MFKTDCRKCVCVESELTGSMYSGNALVLTETQIQGLIIIRYFVNRNYNGTKRIILN